MLGKAAILEEMAKGNIVIDPFDPAQLNPNSYNLRLDHELLIYNVTDWSEDQRRLVGGWDRSQDYQPILDAAYNNHTCKIKPHPYSKMFGYEPEAPNVDPKIYEDPGVFFLTPGNLYLGSTIEYTETGTGLVPCIEGRSSVARLGLSVHLTAGFGDAGFEGQWTLEITVVHPLIVFPGMQICQICYSRLEGEPQQYSGKYQGQRGPQPSRFYKEFEAQRPKDC
jgi:dCTP deaminase